MGGREGGREGDRRVSEEEQWEGGGRDRETRKIEKVNK